VICPNCKGKSKVLETRESAHGIRRRRECRFCGRRFTTFEAEVVQIVEQRARVEVDTPDAAEIAMEVADVLQTEFQLAEVLEALPEATAQALLAIVEDERALANGRILELTTGDDDEGRDE
jgi:transcriptional regulator NrdR family protein